jgi:HEPN domain-containing protein
VASPSSQEARLFYRSSFQRLDEAQFLLEGGRTTGAVYLAGYAVECILKALILSSCTASDRKDVLGTFRGQRAHEIEWLRQQYTERGHAAIPAEIARLLTRVNSWSTDLRYSPRMTKTREARAFLDATSRVLEWADGRM